RSLLLRPLPPLPTLLPYTTLFRSSALSNRPHDVNGDAPRDPASGSMRTRDTPKAEIVAIPTIPALGTERRRWDLNPRTGCPVTALAGPRTRPDYATSPSPDPRLPGRLRRANSPATWDRPRPPTPQQPPAAAWRRTDTSPMMNGAPRSGGTTSRRAVRRMRLSLLAESELPLRILSDLAPRFEQEFAEKFDDGEWSIRVGKDSLPLDADGRVPIHSEAADLRRRWKSDLVIYVTDLPRFVDGQPLVADLSGQHGVALVSAPSHGLALRRRLHETIARAGTALVEGSSEPFDVPNRRREVFQPTPRARATDDGNELFEITGVRAYARLLIGIVRANRPWRLAPALSSASAAAAATGAFGIFYSSIWTMAAASRSAEHTSELQSRENLVCRLLLAKKTALS